jgi:hypothetical protein
MDPYIEGSDLWRDFHSDLAGEIRARLNELLGPRYYAYSEVTITYDVVELGAERRRIGWPDGGIVGEKNAPSPVSAAVALAPAPIQNRVPVRAPVKLFTVEIRRAGENKLVTSIEILSSVNKKRGHEAFEAYRRKREALLDSDVHLIEIDLLRGGERPPLLDPVPPAPYCVMVSRIEQRPIVSVWPIHLHETLPIIPVPLLPLDSDAPLDLGAVVASVYKRGAYERQLDYAQALPPPPLTASERAWVEALPQPRREKQN